MVSSTEYFDGVNSLIRKFERGQTFKEILSYVLPSSLMESTIICKLMGLEHQLSSEEKYDLRVKLIQLATTELFYPLRKIVLIEKERQETIAEESADMQHHMRKEREYLVNVIATTEAKLKDAENSISRKEIENLQEMKEKIAFSKFVLDLPNRLRPEKTVQTLKAISELDKSTTVSELMQLTFHIFDVAVEIKNCPYLKQKIRRDLRSDKDDLLRVLEAMKQNSHIEIDVEGDLTVQGGNVILSSILPHILTSLENNGDIRQVKVCCEGNLVLDVSIKNKLLSGRNVIILANNIVSSEAKVR